MINVFVYGFTSFISQILLIREVIADFGADEITLAFSTGIWIITTAVGVYLGKSVSKSNSKIIPLFHSLSPSIIATQILIIRISKKLLSPIGESLNPFVKFLLILGSVIIYTIISGIYFSSAAKDDEYKNTKTVFVYDSIGFGFAAILSYLILSFFEIKSIIYLIAILNLAVLIKRFPLKYSIYLLLSFTIIIPAINLKLNTKNRYEVFSADSYYGRIRVFSNNSSNYLYYDSSYIYGPQDKEFLERKLTASLLFIKDAENIACVSESLLFCSMFKKANSTLVYINHDLESFNLQKKFYGIKTDIKTQFKNPIHFLKQNSSKFDSFIIDTDLPKTLSWSLVFSKGFLKMLKNSLKKDGIIIIFLSYPQTPNNYEKRAIEDILWEIKNLFSSTRIYYDDFLMIVASDMKTLKEYTAENMYERLYFEYIKTKEKTSQFQPSPTSMPLYLLSILSEISKHSKIPNIIEKNLNLIFSIFLAVVIYFLIKLQPNKRIMIISSFISISCELAAVIFHQIETGYIYRDISLILFSAMLGLSIGIYLRFKSEISPLIVSALLFALMPFLKNLFLIMLALFVSAAMNGFIFSRISEKEGIKTYLYDLIGASLATIISVIFFMINKNVLTFSFFALMALLIFKK